MKVLVGILIVGLTGVASAAGNAPVDWYDCASRGNGNFAHPVDCTRFVACANGAGTEMDCPICHFDPVTCPQGRLIFDRVSNQCLFANEAECRPLCDAAARGGKPLHF